MPTSEFNQKFTLDTSDIEAGLNQLSTKAKAISREILAGTQIPSVTSGPSVAAQAGIITAAIRRAQQLSGGPGKLNKQIEDGLLKTFGGSNFSGITGDPGQAAKIKGLQQQISGKVLEELAGITETNLIRDRINVLLNQSASSIVGRSAVSSARIGALPARGEIIDVKLAENQVQKALPAATDQEVANLKNSRTRLFQSTEEQAALGARSAKVQSEIISIGEQQLLAAGRATDNQNRQADALAGSLVPFGGSGGNRGGGNGPPPPTGSFDPNDFGDEAKQAVQENIASLKRQTAFNNEAASNSEFVGSRRDLSISEKQLATVNQRALSQSQLFLKANTEAVASKTALQAAETSALASSQANARATSELAIARNKLATQEAESLGTEKVLQSAVARRAAELNTKAGLDTALSNDAGFLNASAQAKVAASERKAQEAIALDGQRVRIARARVAQEQTRLAQEIEFIQQGGKELAFQKAELATEKSLLTEKVKIEQLGLSQNKDLIAVRAQRIAAEQKAAKEFNRAVAAEFKSQNLGLFQRAKARTGGFNSGRFEGGSGAGGGVGGFFGGGLLSTAKFALPSAALFGGVSAVGNIVNEAEELDRIFKQLEAQVGSTIGNLDQFGNNDAAFEYFNGLKESVLEVARETGNAGQEVALFAFQLQGAFSGDTIGGLSGLNLIKEQLEGISQINVITDIDNQQVVDSVTSVSQAFGVLADDVGTAAVRAESNLGVSVDNIIDFLGDIAPVAAQAGFSLDELTGLAALSQQRSGRSGTALAESFGRIIPAISGSRQELISLAATNEQLNNQGFLGAVASGNVKDQLLEIVRVFEDLNSSSQDQIIELLGGRREAQVLLTILADSTSLEEAISQIGDESGTDLEERFTILADTLDRKFSILAEKARQVGVALFESGIQDILVSVVDLVEDFLSATLSVLEAFGSLNDLIGGSLSGIAQLTAAVLILNKVSSSRGEGNIFSALSNTSNRASFIRNASLAQAASSVQFAPGVASASPGGAALANATASGIAGGAQSTSILASARAGGASAGAKIGVAFSTALSTATAAAAAVLPFAISGILGAYVGINAGRNQEIFGFDISGITGFDGTEALEEQRAQLINQLAETDRDFLDSLVTRERSTGAAIKDGFTRFFTGVDSNIGQAALEARQQQRQGELSQISDSAQDQGVETSAVLRNIIESDIERLGIPAQRAAFISELQTNFNESQAGAINSFLRNAGVQSSAILSVQSADVERRFNFDTPGAFTGFEFNEAALTELLDPTVFNKIYTDALEAQNEPVLQFLDILRSSDGDVDALNSALAEADSERRAALSELDRRREDSVASTSSIEEAKTAFESGTGTFQVFIDILDANIAQQRGLISLAGDNVTPEDLSRLDDYLTERGDVFGQFLADQDELTISLQNLSGGNELQNIQAEIDVLLTRLNDPNFTNKDDRLKYAQDLLKLQEAFFAASVENAESAEEAVAIAQSGVDVIPEVRTELILAQLEAASDTIRFRELFAGQIQTLYIEGSTLVLDTADDFARVVIDAINAGGAAAADTRAALAQKIGELRLRARDLQIRGDALGADALFDQASIFQDGVDAIDVGGFDDFAPNTNVIDPSVIRDDAAIEKAKRDAETAARDAEREAESQRKAAQDLAKARLDFALALVAGDPVKAAQTEIQQADLAYKQAQDEAGRLRAQIQQIQAQRNLVDAIRDIGGAQSELMLAQANFAGEIIEASQISLQQAQERLSQIQADFDTGNAGEADVLRGQADVLRAQAAARDAELQSSLGDYEFLYDMEQINKSQYIQYLQSLKQIPDLTEEQIRNLDRQIKGLNDELRGDLQFNLPTNFSLPTLYESRRLNQTDGGAGYQDNRQVQIIITVNDAQSVAAVEEAIEFHVGNNRVGTASRRY